MNNKIVNDDAARTGPEPTGHRAQSGILSRFTTRTRWIASAAAALITPALLVAESAAEPIARAMACIGNGSFMALAASANAFTMIP